MKPEYDRTTVVGRRPANISPRLEKQLAMYLVAASAAGVGMTTLGEKAEAKVVYTPANTYVKYPSCQPIDINKDGITDLSICLVYGDKSFQLFASLPAGNFVRTNGFEVQAGFFGVPVGPGEKFGGSFPNMYYKIFGYYGKSSSYGWIGPWADVTNRYVGVKFVIAGATHYGWVRMSTSKTSLPVITGYAYETTPQKSIKEGVISSTASETARLNWGTEDKASLGLLALGAPGLAIWRREEEGTRLGPALGA
ncbi:MAG TPA: hypothetical protein VMH04_13940 [Candidatus Solibacter sp.]|nr:hypothetical protein [Candidatus Solibacter sp.]